MSHDRYFINQTATRILELTGQTLINYIGNYDYYVEKRELMTSLYAPGVQAALKSSGSGKMPVSFAAAPSAPADTVSEVKQDWKAQKEAQARIRKRQNDLKKTEDEILRLETRDSEIDMLLQKEEIFTDVQKLVELNKEKDRILEQLGILYEQWEVLAADS